MFAPLSEMKKVCCNGIPYSYKILQIYSIESGGLRRRSSWVCHLSQNEWSPKCMLNVYGHQPRCLWSDFLVERMQQFIDYGSLQLGINLGNIYASWLVLEIF
jgi:hypothetical protein